MFLVYLCFNVLVLFLILVRKQIRVNPLLLMWITYGIFPMLAALPIMGTNIPNIFVFVCAFISLLSFSFGYFSGTRIKVNERNPHYSIRFAPTLAISLLILGYSVYLLPQANALRAASTWSNDWAFLRYYSQSLFGSSSTASLYESLLLPATWSIFILSLISLLEGNRKAIYVLIINILSSVILSICFAARANLVRCAFYAVFILFSDANIKSSIKKVLSIVKKHKFVSIAILLFVSFLLYYLTAMRDDGTGRSFIDSIYIYYICPYKLFDYMWNNQSVSKLFNEPYFFGGALLGSGVNLICTFFTLFLKLRYVGTDYQITQITSKSFPIGEGISMNAATTAMYPFMRDSGFIGLIVGFLIWGICIRLVEKKQMLNPNIRSKCIYVLMLYVVWKLNMNYEGLNPSFLIAIIFSVILTKRDSLLIGDIECE